MLVVGRGRGGRVGAVVGGARARQARKTLVLAAGRRAAEAAAEEARLAWPAADVFEVTAGAVGGRLRRARFAVVVGTCSGVGDTFLGPGSSAEWLGGVDVLVLHDARLLAERAPWKAMRKVVRMATEGGGTQVAAVVDALERLPPRSVVPGVLRVDNCETVEWEDARPGRALDVAQVPQRYASVAPRRLVPALMELVSGCGQGRTVFFFQTARLAQWFAELFGRLGVDVYEVHSGKTAQHRRRAMRMFEALDSAVMFASHQVSRGADITDVARIIQVGLPRGPEQYEQRLREVGPGGTCLTVLLGYEVEPFFARGCMAASVSEPQARVFRLRELGAAELSAPQQGALARARAGVDAAVCQAAYASWLSCHLSYAGELAWSHEYLLQRGWQWARDVAGMVTPPALPARVVDKLGLRGVRGMIVDDGPDGETLRRAGTVREPDAAGKFKKRRPRGRYFYSPGRYMPYPRGWKVPTGPYREIRSYDPVVRARQEQSLWRQQQATAEEGV